MNEKMVNKKSFKCPLCDKKYVTKQSLYDHMENNHKENLLGLTACHYYFDCRNNPGPNGKGFTEDDVRAVCDVKGKIYV